MPHLYLYKEKKKVLDTIFFFEFVKRFTLTPPRKVAKTQVTKYLALRVPGHLGLEPEVHDVEFVGHAHGLVRAVRAARRLAAVRQRVLAALICDLVGNLVNMLVFFNVEICFLIWTVSLFAS